MLPPKTVSLRTSFSNTVLSGSIGSATIRSSQLPDWCDNTSPKPQAQPSGCFNDPRGTHLRFALELDFISQNVVLFISQVGKATLFTRTPTCCFLANFRRSPTATEIWFRDKLSLRASLSTRFLSFLSINLPLILYLNQVNEK